jgi:hypothetical protein
MNPIDDETLNALLLNNGKSLFATESNRLEFKSNFDWNTNEKRAKYCKSMAAFCNSVGGYLIFGIDDTTGDLIGVTGFDKIDTAKIVDYVNNYLAPAIVIHKRSIIIAGKEIGVIYIEKHIDIPTICMKTFEPSLKEGTIYYRYSAKSEPIKGTDLIHLLHQLRGGNSKEMVDLKKIEMKQNAMPRLKTFGGGGQGFKFKLNFRNEGKRLKLKEINLLKGEAVMTGPQLPIWLEENMEFLLEFNSIENRPPMFIEYEIEILYEDGLGNQYKIFGSGRGPSFKLQDAIEV